MSQRRSPAIYPPSVGELLDRTSLLARSLLYEAPHRDGRVMLGTWGEAVEGASAVWRQLPQRSDVPGNHGLIDQLERSARALQRSAGGGRVDVDPTLQEIGQVFTQAADIISRSGVTEQDGPKRWSQAQLRDAFTARVSIMHTLYVSAHAVSVGLGEGATAEQLDPRLGSHKTPSEELQQRVLDVEQLIHSYLNGHYPQALQGRHQEPVDDSRIPSALSSWDVYTQRTLTSEPTTRGMTQVARAAFQSSVLVHRLWRAAVEAGHVDQRTFETEVSPGLEAMMEKWGEAHSLFEKLSHPRDPHNPVANQAGWELIAAMREVTGNRMAVSLESIGERVDMPSLVRSLHRFHATVAGVAGVFHEASRTADLTVDARAANEMLKTILDDDERLSPPNDTPVIAPRDILQKRAIPLPPALRGRVEDMGLGVAAAARGSLRATFSVSDHRAHVEETRPARGNHGVARLAHVQALEHQQSSPLPEGAGPRP